MEEAPAAFLSAHLRAAMGADAVGFIFAPSPRQISPGHARDIVKRLPPEVLTVGVFRNELPERVVEVVNASGLRGAQRHVAVGHEDGAGEPGRKRVQALPHSVTGAEPALLHGGADRARELVGEGVERGGDLVRPVADDDGEVLGLQRGDGVDGVAQQAAPGDGVQDLGQGRVHARALPCGEHERGARPRPGMVGHDRTCSWFVGGPGNRCMVTVTRVVADAATVGVQR